MSRIEGESLRRCCPFFQIGIWNQQAILRVDSQAFEKLETTHDTGQLPSNWLGEGGVDSGEKLLLVWTTFWKALLKVCVGVKSSHLSICFTVRYCTKLPVIGWRAFEYAECCSFQSFRWLLVEPLGCNSIHSPSLLRFTYSNGAFIFSCSSTCAVASSIDSLKFDSN